MVKFRKRPVVIDAIRWTGKNVDEISHWASQADFAARKATGRVEQDVLLPIDVVYGGDGSVAVEIRTLEGLMSVSEGDWIICGVQGEFYPCKPEIFEKTYEAVS